MNYIGLGSAIMKVNSGNKPSLVKGFQKRLPKNLRFGTSFLALRDEQYGLSAMIGCST
jgi:hypothetical protein